MTLLSSLCLDFDASKVALVLIREPGKKGKQRSPVRTNRVNFHAVLWCDYCNSLNQKTDSCSQTHLPMETQAKSVKPKWQTIKELWRVQSLPKKRENPHCHAIFPQRQLDQQAWWIFNQKVEKSSHEASCTVAFQAPFPLTSRHVWQATGRPVSAWQWWAVLQGTQTVR